MEIEFEILIKKTEKSTFRMKYSEKSEKSFGLGTNVWPKRSADGSSGS